MLRKTLIVSIVLAGMISLACSEGKEGTNKEASVSVDGKPAGELPKTTIQFKDTVYNFGESQQGKEVVHVFEFTNTGKNDLLIINAKAGCGCTVPEWPTEPIAPGQTRGITVKYNGSGSGEVNKTVTVTANTAQGIHILAIKGYVKEKVDGPFKK